MLILPEVLIRLFTLAFSVASIAPFLVPSWRPALDSFLRASSVPLRALYYALRIPLGLSLRRRVWRYPLMASGFGLSVLAALSLSAPYWWLGAVACLAIPLAVIVGWNENERIREEIVWRAASGSPDALPDLRDQAAFASFLLFPAFAIALFRISPALQFEHGPQANTVWLWLLFTFDQFLHALVFDILEILRWPGFSGVETREGLPPNALVLERVVTAAIRSIFSLTLINGVVRLAQIAQTLRDGVQLLQTDPQLVLRLGDRAGADLRRHLARALPPVAELVPTSTGLRGILLEAIARGAPPASGTAMEAAARLRMFDAFPLIEERIKSYAARWRWELDSDYGDESGLRSDTEEGQLDLQSALSAFQLLEALRVADGREPSGEIDGVLNRLLLTADGVGGVASHPSAAVRRAAVRAMSAYSELRYRYTFYALSTIVTALEHEQEPSVLATMFETLRITGRFDSDAVALAIRWLDGTDPRTQAAAKRYLLDSNSVSLIGPAGLERLLADDDREVSYNIRYLLSLSLDPSLRPVAKREILRCLRSETDLQGTDPHRLIKYVARVGGAEDVEFLRSLTNEPRLRILEIQAIAAGLVTIGGESARLALEAMVTEGALTVAELATRELSKMKSFVSKPAVRGRICSEASRVRMGLPELAFAKMEEGQAAVRALVDFVVEFDDQEAVPCMIQLLRTESEDITKFICRGLSWLKSPLAVEPLTRLLDTCREAEAAHIADPDLRRRMPLIRQGIDDECFRETIGKEAALALAEIGDTSAIGSILQWMDVFEQANGCPPDWSRKEKETVRSFISPPSKP